MIGAFFSALVLALIYYTIGIGGCISLMDHADCALATSYAEATPDQHHAHHRSCDAVGRNETKK